MLYRRLVIFFQRQWRDTFVEPQRPSVAQVTADFFIMVMGQSNIPGLKVEPTLNLDPSTKEIRLTVRLDFVITVKELWGL